MLLEVFKQFLVYNGLLIDDHSLLKTDHVVLYDSCSQIHCVLQNLDFLRSISVFSAVVEIQDGLDVIFVQSQFFLMMSQPVVQNINDRFHENIQNPFKALDKTTHVVSNCHFVMSCTKSLRDNLSKNNNCHC